MGPDEGSHQGRPRSRSVVCGNILGAGMPPDENRRRAIDEVEIIIDEVQRSLTPFLSPSQSLRRFKSTAPEPVRRENQQRHLKKRRKSGGWSEATRATAMAWARRAVTMKYLHFIVSQWYDKISRYLSAPVAFLLAGVGTGMVGVAADDSNTTVSYVFMWVLAGLTFLAAGLSAVNWELDPSKLSERHLQKSVYWSSVADDIMLELSLSATEQHDAKWFFPYVQRNISLTENLPPVLPTWVFRMAPSDVLHGAMSRDLMELDRRFGTICGVLTGVEIRNGIGSNIASSSTAYTTTNSTVPVHVTATTAVDNASNIPGDAKDLCMDEEDPCERRRMRTNVFTEELAELQELRNNLSDDELMMIHRRVKDQVKLELNERNLETMFGAGGAARMTRAAAAADHSHHHHRV